MGRYGAPKTVREITGELPDDIVCVILSKLDFEDKVIAGQVCKRWDQLLKAPIGGARHWAVDYDIDEIVAHEDFTTTEQIPLLEEFNATTGRWFVNRAAAIKKVRVTATLSRDEEGVVTRKILESQLPLLVGFLAKHGNTLELTFVGASPFARRPLSCSSFMTFLRPMLKRLRLVSLMHSITAKQFAAICQLSSLEHLTICGAEGGLQEMTSDISKLVKLQMLELSDNLSLTEIPEAISCLQKLEHVIIYWTSIAELLSGVARMANLASLEMSIQPGQGPLRFPPSLQGLKSLSSVVLPCCSLKVIPEVLTGLSALTCLHLGQNHFHSSDGWSWWPKTLSRLTNLAILELNRCHIVSFPHTFPAFGNSRSCMWAIMS